jgi:malate dehydrogenase
VILTGFTRILSTKKKKIMLARSVARALSIPSSRLFSSSAARQTRVAVLGAGGGIGQPLSLLLKSDPLVTSLSLYDIRGAPGVAADVSHINTDSDVPFHLSALFGAVDLQFR